MKRPIVFLSFFLLSIICSTVIVTTAISSLCKSFYKEEGTNSNATVIETKAIDNNVLNTSVKF